MMGIRMTLLLVVHGRGGVGRHDGLGYPDVCVATWLAWVRHLGPGTSSGLLWTGREQAREVTWAPRVQLSSLDTRHPARIATRSAAGTKN
ncbi:hypothetical protein D9M72_602110 [compost metagenome]